MPREYYGAVFGSYWTGATGKDIQATGGVDATLLGAYLMTNRYANMIGLYELPPAAVLLETPITEAALPRAFDVLRETGFADYDADSMVVWVRTMARVRLSLSAAKPALVQGDKRIVTVNRLYAQVVENPFLPQFFNSYHAVLHLNRLRSCGATPKQLTFPQLNHAQQLTGTDLTGKITAAVRRRSTERPVEKRLNLAQQLSFGQFSLYALIAKEAIVKAQLEDHDTSISNVAEVFKRLCATRRLGYTNDLASKAIAAAIGAARRPLRRVQ